MIKSLRLPKYSLKPKSSRYYYCTGEDNFSTKCIHGGWEPDSTTSCALPIYRTSSYVFKDTLHAANLFGLRELGNIYTRLMNPTHDCLEKRVALLEGAPAALALASGQCASFYSCLNLASSGDNIITGQNLYGGTTTLMQHLMPTHMGINFQFMDSKVPDNIDNLVNSRTRAIFVELVSNPSLEVVDLERLSQKAHDHNLPLIVDSTFATPYLCRPLNFGADIIIHSLTKWIGGHGSCIGGIIVDGGKFRWGTSNNPLFEEPDKSYHGLTWGKDLPNTLASLAYILRARTVPLRTLGGCISPDNAWMFLQGLETLPLRMEKHCSNALAVAKFLETHPDVQWVRYPGLENDVNYKLQKKYLNGKGGSVVVFEHKGGKEAGQKFIENLRIFRHLANVGDAKSLAIHNATTTHSQLNEKEQKKAGITPGLIRLSIGIEGENDIIKDIETSLMNLKKI